ncbi:MAG: molecular chaperone DnaJ [Candidatus Zambryskibacteria bacterium]|nr:molecular chaperone DnaJ [Candidatus Zambryskibacteria bacterium]
MPKDYYKSLGVSKNASKEEIKKAFRTLAHQHHPDKGGDAEKFKEINEAYGVLSDEKKKASYDQYGSADAGAGFGGGNPFGGQGGFGGFDFSGFQQGGQGGSFEFDIGDMFGDFFGGGRQSRTPRGRDIQVDLEIPFADSIFGTDHTFTLNKTSVCDHCSGSGAEKGSEFTTCTTCNGKGQVKEIKRTILGQFESVATCSTCRGNGKVPKTKCSVCKGHGVRKKETEIKVKIPAGIETGQTIRLTGGGEAIEGGQTGDLYILMHVKKHSVFKKAGLNLVMDKKIKLTDALLGAEYDIETLDGTVSLKIPEGVTHGEVLKIKGKGVSYDNSKRGDILVNISIDIPHKLSKDARKKIEELRKEGI